MYGPDTPYVPHMYQMCTTSMFPINMEIPTGYGSVKVCQIKQSAKQLTSHDKQSLNKR